MKYIDALNYIFGMAQKAPATAQEHMQCQQLAQILAPVLVEAEKTKPDAPAKSEKKEPIEVIVKPKTPIVKDKKPTS